MTPLPEIDVVRWLDFLDPMKAMRDRFILPDGLIYLDGNSLGALPAETPKRVLETVEQEWGRGLIGSWTSKDWIGAPERIGALIAPLIGARANEVIVADSTSVNLFKLIVAALRARPGRNVVLCEPGNFPTDLYIAGGASATMPGCHVRPVSASELVQAIDVDVAVVVLTHVHYKTGAKLDMASITAAAHAKGALIIWDLCHSAGAVDVDLNGCDADLAVGCGYKYLNGGAGAPAFLFVAERLQDTLQSPLTGWMGHEAPFDFRDDYTPSAGIGRFLCGTPPVIGMAALEQGVALFKDLDLVALYGKSQDLCSFFIEWVHGRCGDHGFELITPRQADTRGSHVSFMHEHAYPICQALIARGVIGDFRAPDVLRMGFTPLYTRFEDVWRAVSILGEIMDSREWDHDGYRIRGKVT
jgi:kynureninase